MRVILIVCALALAACDDSSGGAPSPDLAVVADLANPPDSSSTALSCQAAQACSAMCTAANLQTCVPACIQMLSTAARPYFNALQNCAAPACTFPPDGGVGPCTDPGSQACATCVMASCPTELAACLLH
jgi:hypothetical protein